MKPLASLDREHRIIRLTVKALEKYADALERGDQASAADLGRFATFLVEFADLGHHVKEEDILLPAMVRAGMGWDSGPVARVRRDHDQERYLLRVLKQAAAQEGSWDADDRRHVTATIRAYTEFLLSHIDKEEAILFPAVEDIFDAAQLADLGRELDEFDEQRFGRDNAARLEALSSSLVADYPPDEVEETDPPPSVRE